MLTLSRFWCTPLVLLLVLLGTPACSTTRSHWEATDPDRSIEYQTADLSDAELARYEQAGRLVCYLDDGKRVVIRPNAWQRTLRYCQRVVLLPVVVAVDGVMYTAIGAGYVAAGMIMTPEFWLMALEALGKS